MLKELLARSVDDKASIRLVVLGALPDLIKAAPDGKVEAAVVEAGAGRVLDPEEKVGGVVVVWGQGHHLPVGWCSVCTVHACTRLEHSDHLWCGCG